MKVLVNLIYFSKNKSKLDRYSEMLLKGLAHIDKSNQYVLILAKNNANDIEIYQDNFSKHICSFNNTRKWKILFYEKFLIKKLFSSLEASFLFTPYASYLPLFSFPRVSVIDNLDFLSIPQQHPSLERKSKLRYSSHKIKKLLLSSKHIFTFSHQTSQKLINFSKISQNKITVTPIGKSSLSLIKKKVFQFSLNNKLKETFHIKKNYFLFIGKLSFKKNLLIILQALTKLQEEKKTIPFQFVIAFGGLFNDKIYWKILKKTIKQNHLDDHVIFVKDLSDILLGNLLAKARFLIDLSIKKTFSLSLIEAFDYGIPVLASKEDGFLESGGEACCYVDPFSIDEIKVSLWKMFHEENFRNHFIKKGHARKNFFDWETSVKKTHNVFLSMQS